MDRTRENANPLQRLIGEELSAVVFIRDYVQLQFDGPGLTAVSDPKVIVDGRTYQVTAPGYRDALCERIGHTVNQAQVIEGEEIRIDFDDGSANLRVSKSGELRWT